MEGNFSGNAFDVKEEGGGEANYPFAVNGVIGVPCIDRLLQPCGGKEMFFNETPVEAGDACATVNEGVGVDGFQGVRWFNKLDWNLHRWGSLYIDCSTLYTREDSCQRSFLI